MWVLCTCTSTPPENKSQADPTHPASCSMTITTREQAIVPETFGKTNNGTCRSLIVLAKKIQPAQWLIKLSPHFIGFIYGFFTPYNLTIKEIDFVF